LRTDNAERYTGSIMVTPSFFKDHLKLNINAKGSINNNTFGNTNAIWAASTMNPTIPVYSGLDTFGGYTEAIDNTGAPANGAVMNPVGLIKMNDSQSNVRRFIGNIDADYRVHFFPDLKLHATLGYDYAQGKGSVYVPAEAAQNYTTSGLDYSYGPQKKENRLLTLYANYNKLVEPIKSSFDVTAGYDYQYWKSTTPLYYEMNTLGEIQKTSKAKDERHVLLSYYGRLNYSFNSRYMLTTTVRRDATSRFAKNVRWGTFPSVALGWRVTEESFLKDNKVISTLKVRASYGVTGQQDGIGNYNYLPIYTISQSGAGSLIGDTPTPTYRPKAYVPNLKWETTTEYNTGLDASFLKGKLRFTVDVYQKYIKDLLQKKVKMPTSIGYGNGYEVSYMNSGKMTNKGWEFRVDAVPFENRDWRVGFYFNIAHNENKITEMPDNYTEENYTFNNGEYAYRREEGRPMGSFYGYRYKGVCQNKDATYARDADGNVMKDISGNAIVMRNGTATIAPGDALYEDINHDGVINQYDIVYLGNSNPRFTGGAGVNVSYKQFKLSAIFYGRYGQDVVNSTRLNNESMRGIDNQSTAVLRRWRNEGDQTDIPRALYGEGYNTLGSDRFVEDASYLRLKSLSFNYRLPKKIIQRWGFSNIDV
ncbi:SusC/RagA family TonB-linked outer membrane protein, partial [Bacteroides ovatus]